MTTRDVGVHNSLPAGTTTRFIVANQAYIPTSAIVDDAGNPIGTSNPIATTTSAEVVTYGALQIVAMGNGSAKQIVAANTSRKALVIANVSDTDAYLSINDNSVMNTRYTFYLGPRETLLIESPITTQAIWAADVSAAGKNLVYQEAV